MFIEMHTIIPEAECGSARIEHFEIDDAESRFSSVRASIKGRDEYVKPGKYVRLYVERHLYMSDTQMEQNSNRGFCRNANGHVLIAGLGIGLIVAPILTSDKVASVTIIEQSQDVIDLVAPHFTSDKLTVICDSIFDWKPDKGKKYDSIYFDIWADICEDNLDEISKLHNRFKFYLNRTNPDSFMDSWQRERLKYDQRRNKSYRYAW